MERDTKYFSIAVLLILLAGIGILYYQNSQMQILSQQLEDRTNKLQEDLVKADANIQDLAEEFGVKVENIRKFY